MAKESDLLVDRDTLYYKKNKKTTLCLVIALILTCLCLLCVVILFVGLGITTFLLWPRIPNAEIVNVEQQQFTLQVVPTPQINLYFTFDVLLNNSNYFDININDVDLHLYYQGARLGNITQQNDTYAITNLPKRTENLTIPMEGIVIAAPLEQIQEMIFQFTTEQVNTFLVSGNITLSAISINLEVPVEEKIVLYPTIIGGKSIESVYWKEPEKEYMDNFISHGG